MKQRLKRRLNTIADRLARRLARPVSQDIWNQIGQQTASRDDRMAQLEAQLNFTLRALGTQLAKLQAMPAPAAANSHFDPASARVSILIPTDTRVAAVENLLHCLQYLDGPDFEVIVIRGPTENGMTEMLAKWQGMIKLAHNPERNISISRNLGAAMAEGDILAMIDDDALPEPPWLVNLIKPFENPEVGCVGAADFDYTGTVYGTPYLTMNRLGNGAIADARIAALNFPYSFNLPFARGLNAAYRREAFFAVGGFDEEYEYHYDECDLGCRIVDAGWHIEHLPEAHVHHKSLPSHLRGDNRIMRDWSATLKAKLYFMLVNNKGHFPTSRAIAEWHDFVRIKRADLVEKARTGALPDFDLQKFDADAQSGYALALQRGLAGARRLLPRETIKSADFLPFPRKRPPGEKRRFILACFHQADAGNVEAAARELADTGHEVHLVLPVAANDHIEFETTLWVHYFRDVGSEIIKIIDRLNIDFVYVPQARDGGNDGLVSLLAGRYKVEQAELHATGTDAYLHDPSLCWIRLAISERAAS